MTHPNSQVPDLFSELRSQIGDKSVEALLLLALDDPELFVAELVSSAAAGRITLPEPLIRSLEKELPRIGAARDGTPIAVGPAADEVDPVILAQRRVDAVARRVRESHGHHAEAGP